MKTAVEIQREYYSDTASEFDELHATGFNQHDMALGWLSSLIRSQGTTSVLDVGSGTGRCLRLLKKEGLPIKITGIEPVRKLRDIGLTKGLTADELIHGDALRYRLLVRCLASHRGSWPSRFRNVPSGATGCVHLRQQQLRARTDTAAFGQTGHKGSGSLAGFRFCLDERQRVSLLKGGRGFL